MTIADLISAAAHEGCISHVYIRGGSEQEVRDRWEQMRHLDRFPEHASPPHWYATETHRWYVADVFAPGCHITISTAHEPIAQEVAA